MTGIGQDTILLAFILFCRIGCCLMLMPGFSSTRVPMNVRLFIALAVTLALTPLLLPVLEKALPKLQASTVVALILSETAIGVLIGAMGRVFFLALQFMASAAAMYIGISAVGGVAIEDAEPTPAFASIVTLTATLLFFLTDQHWEVVRALLASYSALPVTEPLSLEFSLAKLTDATSTAFILALQISSPFIVYAVIIHFVVGIANKLTPQIPVYFIATPMIMAGGFFILYFTLGESLRLFMSAFASWLIRG